MRFFIECDCLQFFTCLTNIINVGFWLFSSFQLRKTRLIFEIKNYQFQFSHEISFEMFEFFTFFALSYPQQKFCYIKRVFYVDESKGHMPLINLSISLSGIVSVIW